MTAAGKKRFCADCKKFVHDLSRMKENEAKELLASSADLCVRYVYDALGNVVFDLDSQTVRTSALTRFAKAAAAVALPMSLTACMGAAPLPPPKPAPAPTTTTTAVTPPPALPIAK